MVQINLDDAQYKRIESFVKNIATSNNIAAVDTVHITLTKEASIVKFNQNKEASILAAAIGTFIIAMAHDPDINALIRDFVTTMVASPDSGLSQKDIPQYVEQIKQIITSGASEAIQYAQQQKEVAKKTGGTFEIYFDKVATEGIATRAWEWLKSKGRNVIRNTKNFIFGSSLEKLAAELAGLAASKGYIQKNSDHIENFAKYLIYVARSGFSRLEPVLEEAAGESQEQVTQEVEQGEGEPQTQDMLFTNPQILSLMNVLQSQFPGVTPDQVKSALTYVFSTMGL